MENQVISESVRHLHVAAGATDGEVGDDGAAACETYSWAPMWVPSAIPCSEHVDHTHVNSLTIRRASEGPA